MDTLPRRRVAWMTAGLFSPQSSPSQPPASLRVPGRPRHSLQFCCPPSGVRRHSRSTGAHLRWWKLEAGTAPPDNGNNPAMPTTSSLDHPVQLEPGRGLDTIGAQLAFVEGRNERENNHRGRSSTVLSTQQTFSSFSHLILQAPYKVGIIPISQMKKLRLRCPGHLS